MQLIKIIIAFFISLACCIPAFSQPIAARPFKTLNVAEGLPQSFISGIVEDKTGFIWIGTRDGLARYDGRKFKIFRHIPHDAVSLADNIISRLYLDKQSRLWIVYEAGNIDVVNTQTEAVFHFIKDPVYAGSKTVYSFTDDAKGNTWIYCAGGLMVCNLNSKFAGFYSDSALGLQNNKLTGITEHNGNIILITDTALITINEQMKLVQAVPYTFSNRHLYNPLIKAKNINAIHRNTGDIIIPDEGRLIIYRPAGRSFGIIPLPQCRRNVIPCITQDNDSNVFFDYDSSIFVLSPENKLSIWKSKEDNSPHGAISMLADNSGILWLGFNGAGIQLHDLRLSRWSGMPYEKNFQEDVLQRCLKVPASEIKQTFLYNMLPYLLRSANGNNGKIWLSMAGNQYNRQPAVCFYKDSRLVSPPWHYTDTSNSRDAHVNINAVSLSSSGKLWGIDFYLRPVYFDTVNYAVTIFPAIASVNFSQEYTVNSLVIDGEDVFWVSTAHDGLFRYDKRSGKTVHYFYSESPGSLPVNQLMNIVQDPSDKNILWIGSLGGGLIKFNKISGKCQAFTTTDGLPNNTVYAVTIDARGILWCSSNKGIFSFEPKIINVRSFLSKDGLSGDEFNRYHFLQMPDGRIAFGGVDGYTVFDPLHVADDAFAPTVALTGISINNIAADYGDKASPFKAAINSLDKITLPYTQNFLTFGFAALEYNITEKLQYRYRLTGLDENWVNAGNDNIAAYTRLAPGHYTLMINATNTAGKWSPHIKTLSIIIEPPFWKTWWFTALWVLAAAGLIYLIINYWITRVRKEEQQKAEFERKSSELKAEALRAQMNPHFIFNCLNSIKALIQEDNKQQAVIYLTTFSKLIRNQLNNAQREISLYEELETCRLYTQLEALRFGNRIICEFVIQEGIDIHSLRVPPLILQPFIENAIWHGILPKGNGHVKISVAAKDDNIQCAIEDDGIGRETSMQNKSLTSATYQSKGMKLVQGRLSLHNIINNQGGTIELIDKQDKNNKPLGTLIIVTFKKEA